ncbi:MAG: TrmB family transcriptional regulator [Candidatus Odinarchaeota archaeon]
MANQTIEEIRKFLENVNLNNYEINTYLALFISSKILTAKEISKRSKVPTGRIYEILDKLDRLGVIETQPSRPKKYKAVKYNIALKNLISNIEKETQQRISNLYDEANYLESKIINSNLFNNQNISKFFWSVVFGGKDIESFYIRRFDELQEELLMTGFLNEYTLKIIPYSRFFYEGVKFALERGVKVKILWSFEHDNRPISQEQKTKNEAFFKKAINTYKKQLKSSLSFTGLQNKYIQKRIPTLYDIFDKKRTIIKLQNPLENSRISICINILDSDLAKRLRNEFLDLWLYEASDIS